MNKNHETYLRFVTIQPDEDTGLPRGLFGIAYELKRGCQLTKYEYEILADLLNWFEKHLSIPDRFNKTKSKAYYRRQHTNGICWFKSSATTHIKKMREIAHILSEHGHFINEVKSTRLGYIVYEDEVQIVAEPYADTQLT